MMGVGERRKREKSYNFRGSGEILKDKNVKGSH
jgi:hypothetical protein